MILQKYFEYSICYRNMHLLFSFPYPRQFWILWFWRFYSTSTIVLSPSWTTPRDRLRTIGCWFCLPLWCFWYSRVFPWRCTFNRDWTKSATCIILGAFSFLFQLCWSLVGPISASGSFISFISAWGLITLSNSICLLQMILSNALLQPMKHVQMSSLKPRIFSDIIFSIPIPSRNVSSIYLSILYSSIWFRILQPSIFRCAIRGW